MFLKYNLPAIVWALLIIVLSFMPGRDLPQVSLFQFDKLVHFAFYLILFGFTWYGWKKQDKYPSLAKASGLWVFMFCAAFGVLIEIGQGTLTADRYFDVYDIVANTAGAVFAMVLRKLAPNAA